MRTINTIKGFAAALLLGAVIVSGCKKESLTPSSDDVVMLKSATDLSCEINCIDENSGDAFAETANNTVSWGGPNSDKFSKSGTMKVWNTATQIIYEFTSSANISDLVVNGVSTGLTAPANTVLTYTVALADGWNACDVVTNSFALAGSGPQVQFTDVEYGLIGLCPTGCVDTLTTELTCGDTKELVVTFYAEEAGSIVIQGGLSANTTILSATSNVLTQNTTHPGVVNSKANVTRWEGDIEACQEITVTITYTGGNGIGSWSASRDDEKLSIAEAKDCN